MEGTYQQLVQALGGRRADTSLWLRQPLSCFPTQMKFGCRPCVLEHCKGSGVVSFTQRPLGVAGLGTQKTAEDSESTIYFKSVSVISLGFSVGK